MSEIRLTDHTPSGDGGPGSLWAFVDMEEPQPCVLLSAREGEGPWSGISLDAERIAALIKFLTDAYNARQT
jgi:hypothetical protein